MRRHCCARQLVRTQAPRGRRIRNEGRASGRQRQDCGSRRRILRRLHQAGQSRRNRIDRHLAENQNCKRKVVVVICERDGRTLSQVFPSESASMGFIKARVDHATTVNADEAGAWNELHASFPMKRIDHNVLVRRELRRAALTRLRGREANRHGGIRADRQSRHRAVARCLRARGQSANLARCERSDQAKRIRPWRRSSAAGFKASKFGRAAPGGELMHLKGYCVDHRLLRTGSANFSRSGETRQDNDLVALRAPSVCAAASRRSLSARGAANNRG